MEPSGSTPATAGSGEKERHSDGWLMVDAAVVALAIVLPHQFPVALLDDGRDMRHLGLIEVMDLQIRRCERRVGFEVRGLPCQADEHQPAQFTTVDRLEGVRLGVEVGRHVARPEQAAIEFVGPLMVGADQLGQMAVAGLAQHRPAMAAGVVKGADDTVLTAHDQHPGPGNAQADIAARLGQLARRQGEEPLPLEDAFEIGVKDLVVDVEGLLERVAGAAPGEQLVQFGSRYRHGGKPSCWLRRAPEIGLVQAF